MGDELKDGERVVVLSAQGYMKFAEKYLLPRDAVGHMTDVAYLRHVTQHWGAPPDYPAFVWTTTTEALEEVGPTFPETHVHWETKAELKAKLAEFDKEEPCRKRR